LSNHYDDILNELRQKGERLANQYIVELYNILRDEEKMPPEDCRDKIEHDCVDLWSKATIRKYLPPESKDPKKRQAGKIGGENKKNAMLLLAQNSGEEESTSELLRFTLRHILNQVHNQPEYFVLKQQEQQQRKQIRNNQQQPQLHSQVILPSPAFTTSSHQRQVPNISPRNNLAGQKMTSWKLSSLL
jgi:hypothetical protein